MSAPLEFLAAAEIALTAFGLDNCELRSVEVHMTERLPDGSTAERTTTWQAAAEQSWLTRIADTYGATVRIEPAQ